MMIHMASYYLRRTGATARTNGIWQVMFSPMGKVPLFSVGSHSSHSFGGHHN